MTTDYVLNLLATALAVWVGLIIGCSAFWMWVAWQNRRRGRLQLRSWRSLATMPIWTLDALCWRLRKKFREKPNPVEQLRKQLRGYREDPPSDPKARTALLAFLEKTLAEMPDDTFRAMMEAEFNATITALRQNEQQESAQ